MHQTLEELKNGHTEVVQYFQAAFNRWASIFAALGSSNVSVSALSNRITQEQFWFEQNCGGRWLGQEIMAWSAFAHLYSCAVGFENNQQLASTTAKAFEASMCSLEVKSYAREAAKSYDVA